MLLRALFIALLTSVYSWAGVTSAEGLHQWSNEPSGCPTVTVDEWAPGSTFFEPSWLNTGINVSANGVVYLGNPAAHWREGFPASSVGVDFVAAFGEESVGSIPGVSKISGCDRSLYLKDFKFFSPDLREDTISARITWLADTGFQIDYLIRHQEGIVDTEALNLPSKVVVYRKGTLVDLGPFKRIVSKALVGQDWVITPQGVGEDYSWSFGSNKKFELVERAFSSEIGRMILRAKSKEQTLEEGEVWPLSTPPWAADAGPALWRDFGSFRVVYKLDRKSGEIWRIWFAEDGTNETNSLPSLPARSTWGSYERPLSDFGKDLTVFSSTATTWQELEVGPLKIMVVNPNGGRIEIDSIILTKSQPSSFRILDVKDPDPIVRYELTVSIVGDKISDRIVVATSADSTATMVTGADGKAVFFLPSGTWSVKPQASVNGTIDPQSRNINLQADQEMTFQSLEGRPSLHGDTLFSVSEGDTASWNLDDRLSTNDPNVGPWLASWSIKWGTGAKLPVQIDPATRRLRIGQIASILNGTGRYLIRATLPNGLFVQESLTVVVRPVNQRPQIHAVRWTVPVNGVLAVRLDSVSKAGPVWGSDPDDASSTLVWLAERTSLSPPGMRMSMNGKTVTIAPAENSADSLPLLLIVQDPSGARDTQLVVVDVVPTRMVLFDVKGVQEASSGNVVVHFRSRFTRESADLQRSEVKLKRGTAWGTIPATLEVLEPASFSKGAWVDGWYKVTISRSARWTAGRISGRFDSLFAGQSLLPIRVPLAADGRQDSLELSLASLRFIGPVGQIQGEWKYAAADTLKRSPILHLSWNWDREVRAQFLEVKDTAGAVVWSDTLLRDLRQIDVQGLLDSSRANVSLRALDDLNNPGEAKSIAISASGLYTAKISFTGTTAHEVTGQLCLVVTDGPCLKLSPDASGSYSFPHLRQGRHLFVTDDSRWTLQGDTLAVTILHADVEAVTSLVTRKFIPVGGVLVNPVRGTGDWAFVVRPQAPFPQELPSRIFLRWSTTEGTVTTRHSMDLMIGNAADSLDAKGKRLWTFRLSRADLVAAAPPSFSLGEGLRLDSIHLFTTDVIGGDRVPLRSDAALFPVRTIQRFEQKLAALPTLRISQVEVSPDGSTEFKLRNVTAEHGALQSMRTCLLGGDGEPEGDCVNQVLSRERALRFSAQVSHATPVANQPFLVSTRGADGLPAATVPTGTSSAAGLWRYYSEKDTVLALWLHKETKSWIGVLNPDEISVSTDSGSTWTKKSAGGTGWASFGEISIRSGWNTIAVRLPEEVILNLLVLQKIDLPKPSSHVAADTTAYSLTIPYQEKLLPDRLYSFTLSQTDDLGNSSTPRTYTIFTRPQGALADLSIVQVESTGELHLQSASTRITGAESFSVRLAPGLPTSRASVIARNDSLFELRIPRSRIPDAFLADPNLLKAALLDGIMLRASSTVRECHPVWHRRLIYEMECQDVPVKDSILVRWPGSTTWLNQIDYRTPAFFSIDSIGGTHDSLALSIKGLNGDSSFGTRLPGSLQVTWTPGSSCAPSTTVNLPYGSVFTPNQAGLIAFRPNLGAAILSQEGAWLGALENKQRHQWLDQSVGGGFYPPAGNQATSTEGPWLDFVVRNPRIGTPLWDVWVLPGKQNSESNKDFRWGIEKMASLGAVPGPITTSVASALYESTTPGAWVKVGPVAQMSDTGLYRLRLQMVHDGFSVRGIVLQASGTAAPNLSEEDLPSAGLFRYDSLQLEAGALASATTHTFTFKAIDRKGNSSQPRSVSYTTPASTLQVAALKIQLDQSDSSGWVNGNTLRAYLQSNGDGIAPTSVHADLYILTGAEPEKLASLTVTPDGTGWRASRALSGWPLTTDDLTAGLGYRLDVWGEAQSIKGPHTVAFFGVRGSAHAGQITDIQKNVLLNGLTFRVLEAWTEDGATFANLELPKFAVNQGDTLETRLVLKSARVVLNSASPKVLQSVSNGNLVALRCEGTPVICTETDRALWSLGPWKGSLPVQDASVILTSEGYRVSTKSGEFRDDKSRLARTSPLFLNDGGLAQRAWVVSDRVWFRNVVASGTADAFNFESCRLIIDPIANPKSLEMTLSGCADTVGPFLAFGIHLDTEPPFTLMGEAFDSLAKPYKILWKEGSGYIPQTTPVTVEKTTLKNFSGASVWGYDVHKYTFSPQGVTFDNFDVLMPDGKVFPAMDGEPTRVKNFTGLTVRSNSGIQDGKPTLVGSATSPDSRDLPFNSVQKLTGIASWRFFEIDGYGYVLDPTPAASGLAIVTPQPAGSFRYRSIGSMPIGVEDESFTVPVTKMVFGPGLFAEISSTNSFVAAAGGIKVSGMLSINPSQESMELVASNLVGSARGLSFPMGENPWPKTGYNPWTLRQRPRAVDWTTMGDDIPLSELSLSLDETFGITDISGEGAMPSQSALFVGRLPVMGFQSQSNFRLLAGKGDILVRLGSPSAWFSDLTFKQWSNPTSWIQSAVFNSSTLPVAVGAELPVPTDWRALQFPVYNDLGTLYLNKVGLDASVVEGSPVLALETQSTLELGKAFAMFGLDGWRLALNSLVLEAGVKQSGGSSFELSTKVKSLEIAPLGIPASIELNKGDLKGWYDGTPTTESSPALVRMYTAGQPITGTWDGSKGEFDVSFRNWAIELTDAFPVKVMRGLNFYLDELDLEWKNKNVDITNVKAHGSYLLDSIEVTSGLVLLPLDEAGAKVKLSLGEESGDLFLRIDAARVRMGKDIYNLGCGGNAYVKIRLDGKLEGDFCFEVTKPVALYPFGSTVGDEPNPQDGTSNVWMHSGARVNVTLNGDEITLNANNITVQTDPVPAMKADKGLFFHKGGITAAFSPDGIILKSASLTWDADRSGLGTFELEPFTLKVTGVTLSVADGNVKIGATPQIGMDAGGKACTVSDGIFDVSFSGNILNGTGFNFAFNLGANLTCEVAGFKAEAKGIHIPANLPGPSELPDFASIKVDHFIVDFGNAASLLSGLDPNQKPSNYLSSVRVGLQADGLGYYSKPGEASKKFRYDEIVPIGFDKAKLKVDVASTGLIVWADFDASGLFRKSKPGVLFDNIKVQLPKEIGGQTFNTNFAVRLDGVSPYIHARGNLKDLPLPIPSIELTETIKFDGANLALRFVEGDEAKKTEDFWILEGTAGLTIPGLASGIDVEMALKKPSPKDCRTGVCKAVLTLTMKPGRIPIGTTGLYMTKMMGGFYDGPYIPKCAQACGINTLPNGMKFELAIYVEAADPNSLRGSTGFWMQLNKLNLGLNGQLVLLSGAADATACAAIFNNGSAFHGAFEIEVHAAVDARGGFYIDIWTERNRTNLAAEASASIGVKRGTFIKKRWFKFPRSTWWMGPLVTRFGKFQNGSQGFTTGVRALGRTWGIGYVGGLKLGNMGAYRLAKPTQGALTAINSSDYMLYPLGLNLQGGEALSVAVTTAHGKDWGGEGLHFVPASQFTSTGTGVIPNGVMTLQDLGIDQAERDEEDSSNTHTLTWLNNNISGPMYVAIPRKVGNARSAESEILANTDLLSGYDDLQMFVGLIPPTPEITAQKCQTGDTSEICFSGKVSGFRKDVVEIRRTLATRDFVGGKNAIPEVGTLVFAGKHRLVMSAVPHRKMSGNLTSDSAAAIDISLDEFEGQPENGWSLADNSCTSWDETTKLLTLTNCRWKNKDWRSGTYHFEAGIDEVNLKPADETNNALPLSESAESDVVTLGRVPVTKASAPTTLALLSWKHPANFERVRGLAVYGSGLDSLNAPAGSELRSLRASWIPRPHPDLAGYVVRWPIGSTGGKDFLTGPEGFWSVNLPVQQAVSTTLYDSMAVRGFIMAGPETPEWYFSVPDSLQVIPTIFDEKIVPMYDSIEKISWLDTMTIVVPLDSLAVTWKTKKVLLGQADGSPDNAFSLVTPALPAGTDAWTAPLLGQRTIPVQIVVPTLDTGSTSVRPASDYLDVSVSWLDSLGNSITDTSLLLPSVGVGAPKLRVKANLDTIPVLITPNVKDVLCTSVLPRDSSSAADSLQDLQVCREGQYILRQSALKKSQLKVTVYNQARRAVGLETSVVLPIRVVPPTPKIDNIKSNYLLGRRNQKLEFGISNYWKADDSIPLLHIRTRAGDLVDSIPLDSVTMGFSGVNSIRRLQMDTLTSFHRARALVRLRWRSRGIDPVSDSLDLYVVNRSKQGRFVSEKASILLLSGSQLTGMECADALLDEESFPNNAWAMDFVGFYPKVRGPGSHVRAIFSEIHSPDMLGWKVWVTQKIGSEDIITDIPEFTPWEGGIDFVLPSTLKPGVLTTIGVGIPQGEDNIGEACRGQNWLSSSILATPAFDPANTSKSRIQFVIKDSLVQVKGLLSDESYVWWRGQSPGVFAPRMFKGDPSGFIVPQTDWIHVKVTNTSELVVRDTVFLVRRSSAMQAHVDGRKLLAIDSVRMGSAIVVSSNPAPTLGRVGESSMFLECRWNNLGWAACPSEGFEADSTHFGQLLARPIWITRLGSRVDTIRGEQTTWRIRLRSAAGEGIRVVRLEAPAPRLLSFLDSIVVAPRLLVRRSGDELPVWLAVPPVVRDIDGRVLPQEVERWDVATREYLAWVGVPAVVPSEGLVLQLWLGDTTSTKSPWSSRGNAILHQGEGGQLLGRGITEGPRTAVDFPSMKATGFSSSFWFRWNKSADTLLCRGELCLGTDENGAVWAAWDGRFLKSSDSVLDSSEAFLVSLAWEGISGKTSITINGSLVATGFIHPGMDAQMPASTGWVGSTLIDEVRWEDRASKTREFRLRWENERSKSDFWTIPVFTPGARPQVRRLSRYPADTLAVAENSRLYVDRERTLGAVPGVWQGGKLLQGSGSNVTTISSEERIALPQSSRLCVVVDSGWRPRRSSEWTELSSNVRAGDAVLASWCREMASGVHSLPTAKDVGQGSRLAASWMVLPSLAPKDVKAEAGLEIGGIILPDPLDPLLNGSTLLAGSGDSTGRIGLDGPGTFLVAVKRGTGLGDSLARAGWTGPLAQIIVIRTATGLPETLDVYLRTSAHAGDTLRWNSSQEPVLVFVRQAVGGKVRGGTSSSTDPDGTTPVKIVETDSGLCVMGALSKPWCFEYRDIADPVEIPDSCGTRAFTDSIHQGRGTRWLEVPANLPWKTLSGWRMVRTTTVSRETWVLLSRSKSNLGPETVDLGALWPNPTTCSEFVTWFEPSVTAPPRWALGEVSVRGVGGARKAWGGEHTLRDVDLQPLASSGVTSPQYKVSLSSLSGFGATLQRTVLSLGSPKTTLVEGEEGEVLVNVVRRASLMDLRAEALDADSVHVDILSLEAKGIVRLTLRDQGDVPFTSSLKAVLFRDRNGDLSYTAGVDEDLDSKVFTPDGRTRTYQVDFKAQGGRLFPEETFMAFVDGGATLPELRYGDHTVASMDACKKHKSFHWMPTSASVAEPVASSDLHAGADLRPVHLRSTDSTTGIGVMDSTDWIWVAPGSGGRLCVARAGRDTSWCRDVGAAGSGDLSVRDLDADGQPEILAGNRILSANGEVIWSPQSGTANLVRFDLDDDGTFDTLASSASCAEAVSGEGLVLWNSGNCGIAPRVSRLSEIEIDPALCVDASVSYPRPLVGNTGFKIRVANAGSRALPSGVQLELVDAAGVVKAQTATTRLIHPGEWEDLILEAGSTLSQGSWRVRLGSGNGGLLLNGLLDLESRNNGVLWTEE